MPAVNGKVGTVGNGRPAAGGPQTPVGTLGNVGAGVLPAIDQQPEAATPVTDQNGRTPAGVLGAVGGGGLVEAERQQKYEPANRVQAFWGKQLEAASASKNPEAVARAQKGKDATSTIIRLMRKLEAEGKNMAQMTKAERAEWDAAEKAMGG